MSAIAASAALAATGTQERVHGTVTVAAAAPATAYTYGGKPSIGAVTSNNRYRKSGASYPRKIGNGGFVRTATKHVPDARVVQRALVSREPPARIANIWGGFDHQPTESQVQHAEQARGVAPDAEQRRREERILRQLNRALLKNTDTAAG